MITATNIHKDYKSESTGRTIHALQDVSFSMAKGEKLALIGHNGAGKSTLFRMIAGVEYPTRGAIHRGMTVSWPIGLTGGFVPAFTGNDNIRFICRVYDKPFKEVRDFVDDFAQLGKFLSEPVQSYSSGMRARLNFSLSLAVDFDCFLVDEITSVGDHRFMQRSHEELFEKRADRSLILASHSADLLRSYCTRGLLIQHGRAKMFDDIGLALDIYADL